MKFGKVKLVIIVIAILLLAKIIVTLVALPKISIDYVAKYNEFTKPVGFVPENNSADDYLKACELYIEPSQELYETELMVKWYKRDRIPYLTDIDPNALNLLRAWIKSNKPSIDQIKSAIQKPYCWFERKAENGIAMGIEFPELFKLEMISVLLTNSVRLNILENNLREAIDDVLICYCIGQSLCRENLSLVEQFSAIKIKDDAIESALELLFYSKPTAEDMQYLQESLQSLIAKDDYIPGIETERLCLYDYMQRVYLDWIRGINKPAFRVVYGIRCMCGEHIHGMWINAFLAPSRGETLHQIDRFIELNNQLRDKTPWAINHQDENVLNEIEEINKSNFFMQLFAHPLIGLFSSSQEEKAQTEALVATLAILRFKTDNNRLPDTLGELVSKGYISFLPHDPYCNGTLSYKVEDNDFVLYSYGKDYEDNNGQPITIEKDQRYELMGMGMPETSSLPDKKIKVTVYRDMIYWPVTNIPICYDTEKIY